MTADARARYQQVAGRLRQRIASGEWPVGSRLPGQRALAAEYGVALGTMDRALGVLRDEGMVEVVQGAGTFVTALAPLPREGIEQRLAALEAWRESHEREHGGDPV